MTPFPQAHLGKSGHAHPLLFRRGFREKIESLETLYPLRTLRYARGTATVKEVATTMISYLLLHLNEQLDQSKR